MRARTLPVLTTVVIGPPLPVKTPEPPSLRTAWKATTPASFTEAT
jgi:hypothetical protein